MYLNSASTPSPRKNERTGSLCITRQNQNESIRVPHPSVFSGIPLRPRDPNLVLVMILDVFGKETTNREVTEDPELFLDSFQHRTESKKPLLHIPCLLRGELYVTIRPDATDAEVESPTTIVVDLVPGDG